MKRIATILMLFTIAVTMAFAQQRSSHVQSLSYSGVQLQLGDLEQPTVKKLRNSYVVAPLTGENPDKTNYLVSKKNTNKVTVGVITFRAGRLIKAYRDWTPNDSSSYALALALRGAMEMLKNDGSCNVVTGKVQEPNYLNQSSVVVCGSKYVEVTALEYGEDTSQLVTVYEWLSDFSPDH